MSSGINGYTIDLEVECENMIDEGEASERECGFAGMVEAVVDPLGEEAYWTCPRCGIDATERYVIEADPDYDSDW